TLVRRWYERLRRLQGAVWCGEKPSGRDRVLGRRSRADHDVEMESVLRGGDPHEAVVLGSRPTGRNGHAETAMRVDVLGWRATGVCGRRVGHVGNSPREAERERLPTLRERARHRVAVDDADEGRVARHAC